MDNGFKFGDHSTDEFNMMVEKYPKQITAKRRRVTYIIPGRNGALHSDEGCFENYTQPYECYFHGEALAPEVAHRIKAWLSSGGGYMRLEDAYDPDYYRLATFAGPMDIENILNQYGRCTVNFDCAPQSFLKSGETPNVYEFAGIISNPTQFDALPLITVYGTAAGEVSVAGVTVEIKEIEDQITLDCDLQNAYRQVADSGMENCNSKIYAPVFPKLLPGNNGISFTGGITKVEIIPRWWTL